MRGEDRRGHAGVERRRLLTARRGRHVGRGGRHGRRQPCLVDAAADRLRSWKDVGQHKGTVKLGV